MGYCHADSTDAIDIGYGSVPTNVININFLGYDALIRNEHSRSYEEVNSESSKKGPTLESRAFDFTGNWQLTTVLSTCLPCRRRRVRRRPWELPSFPESLRPGLRW